MKNHFGFQSLESRVWIKLVFEGECLRCGWMDMGTAKEFDEASELEYNVIDRQMVL
jgi:hypothetical protein